MGPRSLSSFVWNRFFAQSIMQFFGADNHWRICRRHSFPPPRVSICEQPKPSPCLRRSFIREKCSRNDYDYEINEFEIYSESQLSYPLYTANLLSRGEPNKPQVFLTHLKDSVAVFGMRFVPSKREMMLQRWIGPNSNLSQLNFLR